MIAPVSQLWITLSVVRYIIMHHVYLSTHNIICRNDFICEILTFI